MTQGLGRAASTGVLLAEEEVRAEGGLRGLRGRGKGGYTGLGSVQADGAGTSMLKPPKGRGNVRGEVAEEPRSGHVLWAWGAMWEARVWSWGCRDQEGL